MDICSFFGSIAAGMPKEVAHGLIWGIMAIGVYITFRILDIADLSVDGTMCTGAAVCAMMWQEGYDMWLILIVATLCGLLVGLVTGFLHTVCGIPAILAGILTQIGLYSVNLKIMGKANQVISDFNNRELLVNGKYVYYPFAHNTIVIVAIFVLVIIFALYLFFGTELGCSIRATGCNESMAKSNGINTNFNKVLGLMISNGLVALSSALLGQFDGSADINMGRGAIVIGLAAVIIGEAIFGKLFKNFGLKLLAVVLGAVIYYLVILVIMKFAVDTDLLKLSQALVVAVFLAVPHFKNKFFNKPKGGKINVTNQ